MLSHMLEARSDFGSKSGIIHAVQQASGVPILDCRLLINHGRTGSVSCQPRSSENVIIFS